MARARKANPTRERGKAKRKAKRRVRKERTRASLQKEEAKDPQATIVAEVVVEAVGGVAVQVGRPLESLAMGKI